MGHRHAIRRADVARVAATTMMVIGGLGLPAVACAVGAVAAVAVPTSASVQPSMVYFADGSTELGAFHRWDGTSVPIEDMAAVGWAAVVATTDGSFGERDPGPLDEACALANVLRGRDLTVETGLTERYVRQFTTAPNRVWSTGSLNGPASCASNTPCPGSRSWRSISRPPTSAAELTASNRAHTHSSAQDRATSPPVRRRSLRASSRHRISGIPRSRLTGRGAGRCRRRDDPGWIIDPGDIDLAADYPGGAALLADRRLRRQPWLPSRHGLGKNFNIGLTEEELRSGGLTIVSTLDTPCSGRPLKRLRVFLRIGRPTTVRCWSASSPQPGLSVPSTVVRTTSGPPERCRARPRSGWLHVQAIRAHRSSGERDSSRGDVPEHHTT